MRDLFSRDELSLARGSKSFEFMSSLYGVGEINCEKFEL